MNESPDVMEVLKVLLTLRDLDAPGRSVGAMLLEQWQFEPEFLTAARQAEDWMREAGGGRCGLLRYRTGGSASLCHAGR